MPAGASKSMETAVDGNDAFLRPLLMAKSERDDAIADVLSTHVYWRVSPLRFSVSLQPANIK